MTISRSGSKGSDCACSGLSRSCTATLRGAVVVAGCGAGRVRAMPSGRLIMSLMRGVPAPPRLAKFVPLNAAKLLRLVWLPKALLVPDL